ncbi:MAG: glycosyltransferase [Flaviaesturariibacter sp.]|nr:glycosyltransferase [Flaviaesturariibacter sp.]
MNNKPLVCVLMPAYNAERFIGAAIRSILDQTFTDFEFIIINDGSTDRTEAIARSFADPRIVVHTQPNSGIAAALNLGLSVAMAPLIARFDADDIAAPTRLERQYARIHQSPGLVLVGSSADYIDEDERFVFSWRPPAFDHETIFGISRLECPFIHSSVLFRKDAVVALGGYDSNAFTFEDHLLWTKLLPHGRTCNLPESLLRVRLSAQSITIDEKWRPLSFRRIKQKALNAGHISAEDGQRMREIARVQDRRPVKRGSYHALLAKKFLWNNHQPRLARHHLRLALAHVPSYSMGYALWLLSFLPARVLSGFYRAGKLLESSSRNARIQ